MIFSGRCPNCDSERWGWFDVAYAILTFRCPCGWIFDVRKKLSDAADGGEKK